MILCHQRIKLTSWLKCHRKDFQRSPLCSLWSEWKEDSISFDSLSGSHSIRCSFTALVLSSYRGHHASSHHAQHALCDLSPACICSLCVCVCARACLLSLCVYVCMTHWVLGCLRCFHQPLPGVLSSEQHPFSPHSI